MSSSPEPPGAANGATGEGGAPVCPRHPGTVAYVRCQRCERPVCPACQRPAAVGVHCVDCVKAQPAVQARTAVGARLARRRPVVTEALLGLLVAVYVAQLVSPAVTQALAFAPVVSRAEPWRFLTAALVHSPGLFVHILFNGLALWAFGRELEAELGRLRYAAVLLVSTIGASVAVLLLTGTGSSSWFGLTVGASGAVFGLLGTGVMLGARKGDPVLRQVGVLVLLAVAGILVPSLSWQGHLGGLVSGVAVGAVLAFAPRRHRGAWQAAGVAAAVLVLLALTLARWAAVGPGVLA